MTLSTASIAIYLFSILVHPLHVTVTEIEYVQEKRQLQVMSRIFLDDMETTLRNELKQPKLDILNPGDGQTTDKLMEAYLKAHLKISVDGKTQTTTYLGHEIEGLAMICYIEVDKVRKWKQIEVTNSTIMDTYDDQSNLVHVSINEEIKSLRLTSDNRTGKLTF
ncbi:MAG: hypothetical protein HC859_02615 [Bacteroidia bacterium]|nr:hypothetical protein [Bacteroidia bacterium]